MKTRKKNGSGQNFGVSEQKTTDVYAFVEDNPEVKAKRKQQLKEQLELIETCLHRIQLNSEVRYTGRFRADERRAADTINAAIIALEPIKKLQDNTERNTRIDSPNSSPLKNNASSKNKNSKTVRFFAGTTTPSEQSSYEANVEDNNNAIASNSIAQNNRIFEITNETDFDNNNLEETIDTVCVSSDISNDKIESIFSNLPRTVKSLYFQDSVSEENTLAIMSQVFKSNPELNVQLNWKRIGDYAYKLKQALQQLEEQEAKANAAQEKKDIAKQKKQEQAEVKEAQKEMRQFGFDSVYETPLTHYQPRGSQNRNPNIPPVTKTYSKKHK